MKDFSNENVGKEFSKMKNMLFIGLFFWVLAGVLIVWGVFKKPSDGESMKELTLNNPVTEKGAYIDARGVSPTFGSSYHFVIDDEYFYVVKMSNQKYDEIKDASDENPIRIVGVTKNANSTMKRTAINYYNQLLEDTTLTVNDYDNEFSSIILDLDVQATSATSVALVFALIMGFCGLGFALAGGVAVLRFKKKIEKISPEERQKIDKEMNDKEAFYYKNAHTYLTKNYIVNFMSTFEAIPYKDVIWVYKFELRQNGIKSQQSVQVMTKDGKNHTIATLTALTKKANDVFNEILETVATKSTNALVGYTKENRNKIKEKIEKPEKKKK